MKGNATAAVNISHHFASKLVSAKKKGCIVFTSSVAGFIPTPFSGMYGATKVRILFFVLNLCIVFVRIAPVSIRFSHHAATLFPLG